MTEELALKIQQIHQSRVYGTIIETGCSTAISAALFSQPGASKTVYFALQPYSKEYEHARYGKFARSVSQEFVAVALDVEKRSDNYVDAVNTILVTSWQMNDGDATKYAHGWYAIHHTPANEIFSDYYIHFSIPRSLNPTREKAIEIISEIGVNILHSLINGNLDGLKEYRGPAVLDICSDTSLMVNVLEGSIGDYPLVFSPEGPIRFEDLMRQSSEFIVQKGSFNPLHHQHVHIMDVVGQKYPEAKKVFLISTFRYDKPHIDVTELLERVFNIIKHGYTVIVCKEIYFYATFNIFRRWADKDKKFYFTTGTDTINRIYKTDCDAMTTQNGHESSFANCSYVKNKVSIYKDRFKFVVLPRSGYTIEENIKWYDDMIVYIDDYQDDGISSTAIREGRIQNLID